MMNNKKGLSDVVTTLIIILLVIVAVGILWVALRGLITKGTTQISNADFTKDLQVQKVTVNSNSVDVKIKLNQGTKIDGVLISISDGTNSQSFERMILFNAQEEKTLNVNYTGIVNKVSVYPIIINDQGQKSTGQVPNVFNEQVPVSNVPTTKQILMGMGVVSWWKFNGDANDEIGNNNGTLNGGTNCNVNGVFGNACNFNSINNYIIIADKDNLNFGTNNFSVSAWIKSGGFFSRGSGLNTILSKGDSKTPAYSLEFDPSNITHFVVGNYANNFATGNGALDNNWHHVVGVRESGVLKIYIDGIKGTDGINQSSATTTSNLVIGDDGNGYRTFTGSVDEVMIFNRALTSDQVQALYNMNLSRS